jgi:hypothetical protein
LGLASLKVQQRSAHLFHVFVPKLENSGPEGRIAHTPPNRTLAETCRAACLTVGHPRGQCSDEDVVDVMGAVIHGHRGPTLIGILSQVSAERLFGPPSNELGVTALLLCRKAPVFSKAVVRS